MSAHDAKQARLRTRWSAIGAAVAVSLGAGGIGLANAAIGSGDKPVTVTIEAERILDTRTNLGLSGRFADATPRELQVTGSVPVALSGTETVVPDGATAVLVKVTVVFPSDPGFLALRSGGATGEPSTSTVNFFPGTVEPNAATVDLSPDGKIQIWVETSSDSGNAHVLIDVVGYTIDHTHDDRYYTETEVDALIADNPGPTGPARAHGTAGPRRSAGAPRARRHRDQDGEHLDTERVGDRGVHAHLRRRPAGDRWWSPFERIVHGRELEGLQHRGHPPAGRDQVPGSLVQRDGRHAERHDLHPLRQHELTGRRRAHHSTPFCSASCTTGSATC